MKRSNPGRYAKPRFGRHETTIGARQGGIDVRLSRLAMLARLAQVGGTPAADLRIYARRLAQGKRV